MGRRHNRRSSQDLKRMLLSPTGGRFMRPEDPFDEVIPGVLLGDASTALSTLLLKEMKVTHVLNAAQGSNDDFYGGGGFVNTSPSYYDRIGIKFMGVPALDTPSFYLRPYYEKAANFIADALRSHGKVLVHCQCGISRSAVLIASYLMIKKGMNCDEALAAIRTKRSIFPNQGFLSQLCDYDYELQREGVLTSNTTGALDRSQPIKDSLRNYCGNSRRQFTDTNYYPIRQPHSRSGYDLSSAFNYDSRSRARSEDRYLRDRSPSPSAYRRTRSSSVLPDGTYYWDRPVKEGELELKPMHERPVSSALLSTHELTRPFQTSYSFSRQSPAPNPISTYTPRDPLRVSRALRDFDRAQTVSLVRHVEPVRSDYTSRPYTSYGYPLQSSPVSRRSYESYSTPSALSTYANPSLSPFYYKRPTYTPSYTPTYRSYSVPYVSSVFRYPSVNYSSSYRTVRAY